jgi:hypothetical protein
VATPKPAVYFEGEGAILPDGRFVPEPVIQAAVDTVMALCRWIESLPLEARVALEVEAAFAEIAQEQP